MKSNLVLVLLLIFSTADGTYAQNNQEMFRGIVLQCNYKDKTVYLKENSRCRVKVKKNGNQRRTYRGSFTLMNDSTLIFPQGRVSMNEIQTIYVRRPKCLKRGFMMIGGGAVLLSGGLLIPLIDLSSIEYYALFAVKLAFMFGGPALMVGGSVVAPQRVSYDVNTEWSHLFFDGDVYTIKPLLWLQKRHEDQKKGVLSVLVVKNLSTGVTRQIKPDYNISVRYYNVKTKGDARLSHALGPLQIIDDNTISVDGIIISLEDIIKFSRPGRVYKISQNSISIGTIELENY